MGNNETKLNIGMEEELQDAMMFDTEVDLAKKEKIWKDIFSRCPEFSDYIIKMYEAGGEKAIAKLHDYLGEFQDLKTEE